MKSESSLRDDQTVPSAAIRSFAREEADAKTVRETFQLAMHDDPVARYIAKDASYRSFWDNMIDSYLRPADSRLNFVMEGCNAAVLARIYPEEQASFFAKLMQIIKMLPCTPLHKWKAGMTLDSIMGEGKKKFGKEHGSFIYIFLLGTRPEHQRKGLGGALLEHINTIADKRGMYCWLESSSEGSRRLYKRHGYVDVQTGHAAPDAPPLFLMMRPPAKKS